MTIPLAYIAGPYSGANTFQTEANIFQARLTGEAVSRLGAMPVIPQANTAHFDHIHNHQWWYDATMQLMRRCDVVVMSHRWEESTGAKDELNEAEMLEMPVFFPYDDTGEPEDGWARLREWIEEFLAR
jgi:hypothetical protein